MGVGGSAMGRGLSPHIHLTQEVSHWSYMSVWMLVLGERRGGREGRRKRRRKEKRGRREEIVDGEEERTKGKEGGKGI